MRSTVLTTLALAGSAVLASALPAFADGPAPSAVPTTRAGAEATPAPAPAEPTRSEKPVREPAPGQVSVVPEGAPRTGVAPVSEQSGTGGALMGTGAVAALGAVGAVFVVRRRRATGA
ncbi:sortase-dependent protein [Streptomyces sp. NPDC047981]|uniref:sortase-dependent protein n=1 Tax=Streptomyces sp. NPDC047981 TaxID=3154610 RepID=UPI003433E34D